MDAPVAPVPAVELIGVTRRFGAVTALDGIQLSIGRGEYFSLLGPSGCGKSTLLRLVAGLDLPEAGDVRLGGRVVTPLPAHRRPVNTVFQSYALFPHLNVRDNIAFGLRMKRVPVEELRRRVADVMALTRVTELGDRRPSQLSGGQRQRVALARALVNEPEVLLLDEPLGALDLQLRQELRAGLRALQRRLGITFLHVTHDQEEALALSDRIAVLNVGRVEQCGSPAELYERPRTRFVAQFLGACNLVPGTVRAVQGGEYLVETALGSVTAMKAPGGRAWNTGDTCTLAVRPERLSSHPAGSEPGPSGPEGVVVDSIYRGADRLLTLEVTGLQLRVAGPGQEGDAPLPGQRRRLAAAAGAWVLLED